MSMSEENRCFICRVFRAVTFYFSTEPPVVYILFLI
jgi:hypothetical protein